MIEALTERLARRTEQRKADQQEYWLIRLLNIALSKGQDVELHSVGESNQTALMVFGPDNDINND